MSWRFIFAILVLAAGASAWGGLRLGDWLVAHGPVAPIPPERPELSAVPVLDANGLPYVAQPPQPLLNGQQGVPDAPTAIAWQIPETSLDETTSNPAIPVATTPITMDEAQLIAQSNNAAPGLQGIADVGSLGLGASTPAGQKAPLQPIEVAPPPPPPPVAAAGNNQAWQASLRQDLQACSAQGFFDRPSCAWTARNKYCEPNNAWGRVRDCPAKSF
ncbi:hypothetical protein V0R37_03475 [Pollutimonas sp. H1-120]|uniref:hypothetical protein n=1 Tax=Pollutimonas sp. H1-120 TaxID=3148824 RepID=UPI003B52B6CA